MGAAKNVEMRKKHKINPITVKNLKKYSNHLKSFNDIPASNSQHDVMKHMGNSCFNTLCDCMGHFLKNKKLIKEYFNDEETGKLSEIIKPWSKSLKQFTNPKTSRLKKRKLLARSQKGGNVILAALVGSLLPMAVHAVENWIWPKKEK